MITVLEYLVIAVVIGAVIFGIAVVVFGRGEQMAALPARTSPSELPASGIRGNHVREVRFGLALRGYRMSDVDWTLERLADEIDQLRAQLPPRTADDAAGGLGAVTDDVAAVSARAPVQHSEWQDDTAGERASALSAAVSAGPAAESLGSAYDDAGASRRDDSDTESVG